MIEGAHQLTPDELHQLLWGAFAFICGMIALVLVIPKDVGRGKDDDGPPPPMFPPF